MMWTPWVGPGRKLGNHGNSSCTKELQILPIKIKKDKHKSEFDKVWEKKPVK